jgi:rhodanese-related sulfurtransferase
MKKLIREIIVLVALSSILGAAVHFSLVRRFVRGEFKQGFLDQGELPGIRFITLAETEDLFGQGRAVFVDSRSGEGFAAGHIPGALNIPLEESKRGLPREALAYPPDQILIVYCEGGDCQTSISLAKLIHALGFRDLRIFAGGWTEWSAAGLPVEPSR